MMTAIESSFHFQMNCRFSVAEPVRLALKEGKLDSLLLPLEEGVEEEVRLELRAAVSDPLTLQEGVAEAGGLGLREKVLNVTEAVELALEEADGEVVADTELV